MSFEVPTHFIFHPSLWNKRGKLVDDLDQKTVPGVTSLSRKNPGNFRVTWIIFSLPKGWKYIFFERDWPHKSKWNVGSLRRKEKWTWETNVSHRTSAFIFAFSRVNHEKLVSRIFCNPFSLDASAFRSGTEKDPVSDSENLPSEVKLNISSKKFPESTTVTTEKNNISGNFHCRKLLQKNRKKVFEKQKLELRLSALQKKKVFQKAKNRIRSGFWLPAFLKTFFPESVGPALVFRGFENFFSSENGLWLSAFWNTFFPPENRNHSWDWNWSDLIRHKTPENWSGK